MTQAQRVLLAETLNGSVAATLLIGVLGSLPWRLRLERLSGYGRAICEAALAAASLGVLWLSLMSLASQAYNPFIYFRF